MRFSKDPPDDFENMSFADIAKQHFADPHRYSDEDFAEARKNLKIIEERNRTDIKENSLQLDKHIVWLSGGALVLVANISFSAKFTDMTWNTLLVIAFSAFGISIIAVVTSYRKTLQSLVCIPDAQAASSRIEEHFRDLRNVDEQTAEDEKQKIRYKFENDFDEFKGSIRKGRSIEKWVPILNNIAYWGFLGGMITLLLFGIANLL